MRLFPNSSLEVLEVSKDDAGEYVCSVDVKGATLSQAHLINIAGEDEITTTDRRSQLYHSSSIDHLLAK